jgi:hypothetical protein
MKFGIVGPFWNSPRAAADLAQAVEAGGWDGFFVGEALWGIDAWVVLTAAAMRTERIRLGTLISPLPSMQPRKVASQSATLDHLSNGRVILSLGMGATWMGYSAFPDEATDIHIRAELMDEALDILNLLYRGEPVDYEGKHHHLKLTTVDKMHYPPRPVQQPRIPIWMVGVWPRMKSMGRVLKCDGLIAAKMDADGKAVDLQPADIAEMKAYIEANRTLPTPFDIIVEGNTLGMDRTEAADRCRPWADAGATWWIETLHGVSEEEMGEHLRRGPARNENAEWKVTR